MNRLLLLLFVIITTTSCKSKEEKALELIDKNMFATLYDYDSYRPVETKVDSAFMSVYQDSIVRKYAYILTASMDLCSDELEDCKEYIRDMSIWSDSYSSYGRSKFYDARSKAQESQERVSTYLEVANTYQDSIILQAKAVDTSFIGWEVTHKFRCKTKGGHSSLATYKYIVNNKVEDILFSYDTEDEDELKLRNLIDEALSNVE